MMWRKLTLNLPSESYLFPGDTYLEVSLHGQVSVLVSGEENTQNTHAFLWYLATALGAVNKPARSSAGSTGGGQALGLIYKE